MSKRLFDVVKTNDDLKKITAAIAHGIDATDVQDALEDLGFDVEVDTVDWNTWSQIEISGGENETGVIITLVVKEVEIGFDRMTVGEKDLAPTPPADDVRDRLVIRHVGGNTLGGTVEQVLSTHLAKGWSVDSFEARQRRTVTDAAVDTVWAMLELDNVGHLSRSNVRVALEKALTEVAW